MDREVPRMLYKYRRRVSNAVLWEIADAARALRSALKAGEIQTVSRRADLVEDLIDHYIQFDSRDELWEYAETLVAALLIALFIRTFLFEAFKIPSGSMIPTLMVNDHIFVSKFVYGVRVPFTRFRIMDWRTPARGEVVVFEYPGPGPEHGTDFIKRVIAVAGDEVRLEANLVYVNGEVTANTEVLVRREPCLLSPSESCTWLPTMAEHRAVGSALRRFTRQGCPCTLMHEAAGDLEWVTQHVWPNAVCSCQTPAERPQKSVNNGEWPYLVHTATFLNGWGEGGKGATWKRPVDPGIFDMEVPPGYVFVMGDNRDNSKDGRFWGLVPLENVRGKALFIWRAGPDVWTPDWSRMFRLVH